MNHSMLNVHLLKGSTDILKTKERMANKGISEGEHVQFSQFIIYVYYK